MLGWQKSRPRESLANFHRCAHWGSFRHFSRHQSCIHATFPRIRLTFQSNSTNFWQSSQGRKPQKANSVSELSFSHQVSILRVTSSSHHFQFPKNTTPLSANTPLLHGAIGQKSQTFRSGMNLVFVGFLLWSPLFCHMLVLNSFKENRVIPVRIWCSRRIWYLCLKSSDNLCEKRKYANKVREIFNLQLSNQIYGIWMWTSTIRKSNVDLFW